MNMTGLIQWCEGWTCCPLLSSCQSGYCLSHSLAPRCHQLARAQVSLRHRYCCLPPSVTSLIISLRWVHYLTHRGEEGNTAHAHTNTTYRHKAALLCITTHILVESGHRERHTIEKTHTTCLCAQTPTHIHAWTQSMCQHLSVFC